MIWRGKAKLLFSAFSIRKGEKNIMKLYINEKNRKIFTKRRYSSQCPKQEKEW